MNVDVVFAGHVDHGKSTLIGRLLYDSESITDGRMAEVQKLAEEFKKRFEFAYFLDAFEDEMREERTIDTTVAMFKGKNHYVVTDVPGHKEFIKNMLTGASHADVAVLVVSAFDGIQEQTRRHLFLLEMIGIREVFVVVNKMDAVDYRRESFEYVKKEVGKLLNSFGYADARVIPISAMESDNVFKRSGRMRWYSGPTLIEALDDVKLSREDKATRFVVQDVYTVGSEKVVVGRVESGVLRKGEKMFFEPSGVEGEVKKIMVLKGELEEARKGDSVGIVVDCEVKRGDVCGPLNNPPIAVREFLGEAVLLEKKLVKGEVLELRCGTARVWCKVKEIREKINSETGEVMEECPEEISENEAANVIFKTDPLVVEKFSEVPELGRFVLYKDKNIGAGVVLGVP
ncbi:MAG: GTP-binding protein [Candidatus Bathyarchaeia archaeon]